MATATQTIELNDNVSRYVAKPRLMLIDGKWVAAASGKGVAIAPNVDADPSHSPETGLPFQTEGLR